MTPFNRLKSTKLGPGSLALFPDTQLCAEELEQLHRRNILTM